jgi:hypothetical protein
MQIVKVLFGVCQKMYYFYKTNSALLYEYKKLFKYNKPKQKTISLQTCYTHTHTHTHTQHFSHTDSYYKKNISINEYLFKGGEFLKIVYFAL